MFHMVPHSLLMLRNLDNPSAVLRGHFKQQNQPKESVTK